MSNNKQKVESWQLRNQRKKIKNNIAPRKKYLICTEGKTEAIYFNHYKSSTGPFIISLNKSDQKVSLVKKTIEEKNKLIENGDFDSDIDEVWVVIDRDIDPQNKQDKHYFNQALELAKFNNVFIAYSNDAFELWYVLHYQDLQTSTHRDDLIKLLDKHTKRKYSKPYEGLYKEIHSLQSTAIKRAKNLFKLVESPEKSNPSTSVHILVEKLINEPGYRAET